MTENVELQDRVLTEEDFLLLKNIRNNFLSSTDKYMLLTDIPNTLKNKIITYRDTIRNIDTKFGTEWKKMSDVNWPQVPEELITKIDVPFVPPEGSNIEV